MEIERKFKILDFPTHLPLLGEYEIYQGYLDTAVLRFKLREQGVNYILSIYSEEGYIKGNAYRYLEVTKKMFRLIEKYLDVFTGEITGLEVRVRSKYSKLTGKTNYKLTIKSKGDLEREEEEVPIQLEDFDKLKEVIGYQLIHKDYRIYQYYCLNLGNVDLECSRVDGGSATEFCYAEVEFNSREETENFVVVPTILLEDCTADRDMKMYSYWERTRKGSV